MNKNSIDKKPFPKKITTKTFTVGENFVDRLKNLRNFRGCKTQMKGDDLNVSIQDFLKNEIIYIYYIFKNYANYKSKG